jgi:hypothetical protein
MAYDKSFVDTPLDGILEDCNPNDYKGSGSGTYDGIDTGPFGGYKRTPSSNGVPEKVIDKKIPFPSGESDQF